MSNDEVTRLQDRIAELEEIIGLSEEDANLIVALIRCSITQAKIISMVRKRNGAISRNAIFIALYGSRLECDMPEDPRVIDVFMSKIRKQLPDGVKIKCVHGYGYIMPPDSRKILTDLMHAELERVA